MLDVTKLAKVMELTRSTVPGERVAALGLANGMLEAAGLTWADVLRAPEVGMARPFIAGSEWGETPLRRKP